MSSRRATTVAYAARTRDVSTACERSVVGASAEDSARTRVTHRMRLSSVEKSTVLIFQQYVAPVKDQSRRDLTEWAPAHLRIDLRADARGSGEASSRSIDLQTLA